MKKLVIAFVAAAMLTGCGGNSAQTQDAPARGGQTSPSSKDEKVYPNESEYKEETDESNNSDEENENDQNSQNDDNKENNDNADNNNDEPHLEENGGNDDQVNQNTEPSIKVDEADKSGYVMGQSDDEQQQYEHFTQAVSQSDDKSYNDTEKYNSEADKENPVVSAGYIPQQNSSSVGENDQKSWWFKRNSEHTPPTAQGDINIAAYDAYYLGDIDEKVIYLTFDEGYENGYSSKILDVLAEKDVKAAFFVTKPYIESEPELIKRMVDEGHVVGNHSVSHPKMNTLSDEQIAQELKGCADAFKELTGQDMPPFFRPPEGVYSIRSLEKTKENGYKTIFWSYAYADWDVNNQPGRQAAYDMAINNHHNGAIMLLHAVSQSNTEALGDIIDSFRAEGYVFKSLYDLPEY